MNAKTYSVRESEIERRWYVVDATDETLGRLASRIAPCPRGQAQAAYQPNLDSGDHVIVLNAVEDRGHPRQARVEALLASQRVSRRASSRRPWVTCWRADPKEVIRRAVKGMLPHNRLGAQQLRKLKVYAGSDHPHQAQQPEPLA